MNTVFKGILTTAAFWLASPAMAGLISHNFSGNDCSGYFGTGFDACQIFVNSNNERIEISPVIAKYGFEDDTLVETEINDTLFPSFDGSEIDVSFASNTWSYTMGENDPGIRYWAAKGGNNFNLFWYVDDADEAACAGDTYTYACLSLALAVTAGSWATPGGAGLSHITFYDSEPPVIVPEPATLGLLGLSLLGLGMARRRKA